MSNEEKMWELRKKYSLEVEDLISLQDVVAKAKAAGVMDLPLRKVRYNVTHGLLRKTIRKGRESYFERAYIFPALDCVSIFQDVFKLPLRKIKKIMVINDSSIIKLHEKIKMLLEKYSRPGEKPAHYYLIEKKFLDKLTSGELDIDIVALENSAKKEYAGG